MMPGAMPRVRVDVYDGAQRCARMREAEYAMRQRGARYRHWFRATLISCRCLRRHTVADSLLILRYVRLMPLIIIFATFPYAPEPPLLFVFVATRR